MASNWIHRLLHPHCADCHNEIEESHVCKSCETLKEQLESANYEKNKLLERILERPVVETPTQPIRQVTIPRNVPWEVRRQMLEREDREKAKLLKNAPVPQTTEDLEKDLNIIEHEREKVDASK